MAKQAKGAEYRQQNTDFLTKNASKPGVVTTASGLQYKIIEEGDGPKPTANSAVSVYYKGTFINGKQFDSNMDAGYPMAFRLKEVIYGWREILPLMSLGSTYEVYIPFYLGYGDKGVDNIRPFSTLIFTIKLVGVA